jgi:hypothetical protein
VKEIIKSMKNLTIRARRFCGEEVTETAWKPYFCGVMPQGYIYGDHPTVVTFKEPPDHISYPCRPANRKQQFHTGTVQ